MKYEIYNNLRILSDFGFTIVEFVSVGEKGNIPKRIVFEETDHWGVYNLAFGDVGENGEIDDNKISDNGDRDKILATVAAVVMDFTKRYPDRFVIFSGSTLSRTRLYRRAITLNFEELSTLFEIYGYQGNEIIPFSKNSNVDAFLVKRKVM